jgi:hypothetical protein
MTSVRTTMEDFFEDTDDLFPLERGDTIEGVYDTTKFSVRYDPPKEEELECVYGTYNVQVFRPSEDWESKGGYVFYTEVHSEPDEIDTLLTLFKRGQKAARRVATDDSIVECPYCGFMASTHNRVERTLSMFRQDPIHRMIPALEAEGEEPCAGLSSWLPPRVEVFRHNNEENLLFSDDELESCDTLVVTEGYPTWKEDSAMDAHSYFMYRTLLEKHPEVFKSELDTEMLKEMLESIGSSKSLYNDWLDRYKFTYQG